MKKITQFREQKKKQKKKKKNTFFCGNITLAPSYGVFMSQLIPYVRACRNYPDFLYRSNN